MLRLLGWSMEDVLVVLMLGVIVYLLVRQEKGGL